MYALQIELNGRSLAVAGSEAAILLSAGISLSIHESGGTLDVSGMEDLGNDVSSHLSWVEMIDLSRGDRVTVNLVQVATATPPYEARRTDSTQYVAERAAYEDDLRENPLKSVILESKQAGARLALHWRSDPPIVAVFESGREFISCRFSWNSFRPDSCHMTFSSFSQVEALGRTGGRDWFSGTLNVGEGCAIELEA